MRLHIHAQAHEATTVHHKEGREVGPDALVYGYRLEMKKTTACLLDPVLNSRKDDGVKTGGYYKPS